MKTRILIVRNPVTLLFMLSYIYQEKQNLTGETFINIALIFNPNHDETYSKDAQKKDRIQIDMLKQYCQCASIRTVELNEPENWLSVLRLKKQPLNALKELKARFSYFMYIRRSLCDNNIDISEIQELWDTNGQEGRYVAMTCRKIKKFIMFEHGISEVKNAIRSVVKQWPSRKDTLIHITKWISFHYPILSRALNYDPDFYCSLLAEEINNASGRKKTLPISSIYIHKASSIFLKNDPLKSDLYNNLIGNSSIVLLDHVKAFTSNPAEHLAFFKEFGLFIRRKMDEVGDFSKYIIFKPRFFNEEAFAEAYDFLQKLFPERKTFRLDHISPNNTSAESYASYLQPVSVWGNFSSALLYIKKILPTAKTYSYHSFFHEYCRNKYQKCFPDFEWVFDFFCKKYGNAFKAVLPQDVGL